MHAVFSLSSKVFAHDNSWFFWTLAHLLFHLYILAIGLLSQQMHPCRLNGLPTFLEGRSFESIVPWLCVISPMSGQLAGCANAWLHSDGMGGVAAWSLSLTTYLYLPVLLISGSRSVFHPRCLFRYVSIKVSDRRGDITRSCGSARADQQLEWVYGDTDIRSTTPALQIWVSDGRWEKYKGVRRWRRRLASCQKEPRRPRFSFGPLRAIIR